MRTALGAFAASFGALALVTAPSVHALDSGELAGAGVRLGLSHPPGQPLHALLVRAAALLPFGDLGFRANLISALGASIAAALVALGARRVGVGPLGALSLGLTVAVSGPVVENATRTEVYTPALALVAAALLAVFSAAATRGRSAAAAGLWGGLAACLHPGAAIAIGLAHLSTGLREVRAHVRFAVGAVVGLTPLAYCVIRGRADPQPFWDAPRGGVAFLRFVTGSGYGKNFDAARLPAGLVDASWIAVRGTGVLLVAVALYAALHLRDRPAARALVIAVIALLPAAPLPFLFENPDLWGYTLPAIALVAFAAMRGAARLPAVAMLAVFVAAAVIGGGARGVRPRSRLVEARIEEALEALPPRAVLVADSDLAVGAVSFLQAARGTRPDVAWIAAGLATQEAPWARIRAQDPRLAPLPALAPGAGDPRERALVALYTLAHARVPCFVEDARGLRGAHEWTGWGHLGAGDPGARPHWMRLSREARGDETVEEAVRTASLRTSELLAAQDEPRSAARALLVGLGHPRADLRALVRALPARASLSPEPPDATLQERFGPDERTLERAIARVAWRTGRPADAVRLLERSYEDGDDEAAAQLAMFALSEGRRTDAQSILQALVAAHPDREEDVVRVLGAALRAPVR